MELCAWGSDWGVASVDPACLSMMTYAKFSGAPVTTKATNNPFWSPKGSLPVLRSTSGLHHSQQDQEPLEITDFRACVEHLKECGYSADYNLSARQQSEVLAFGRLIEDRLKPALCQVFWLDAKNQLDLTRPWFASKMGMPLSLFYPNKMVTAARDVVSSHIDVNCDAEDTVTIQIVEAAVYKKAEECLTVLARRLGEEPYFFGKSPSSLDALMYGYLAPLLKAPLPNPTLQNHLKGCINLVSFVVRISQNYFAEHSLEYERKERVAAEEAASQASSSEAKPLSKTSAGDWLRPMAAAVVSCSAMLGYAHFSGLVDLVRSAEASRTANDHNDDED